MRHRQLKRRLAETEMKQEECVISYLVSCVS
jgi:hypothetical protein